MLIGLIGNAGSGKSTCGNVLISRGFTPLSFGSILKDICALLFYWPRHLLEGDTEESRVWRETPDEFWSKRIGKQITPRYALQFIGTECLRNTFHKDIFLAHLERVIQMTPTNIVITDCRFPNECEFIRQLGGTIIRITRPSTVQGTHISETALNTIPADFTIVNDSTIEELHARVNAIYGS